MLVCAVKPPRFREQITLVVLSLVFLVSCVSSGGETMPSREHHSYVNANAFESTPQVRSLSALVQIVYQLRQDVAAKDLGSLHNEDAILSICLKPMIQRLDVVSYAQREQFKSDLAVFAQHVSDLHLAGDAGQQAQAEAELARVIESFERVKNHFPEWTVTAALKSTNRFTCPMHPDIVGNRTNFCPKCGMELNQLNRILPPDSEIDSSQQVVRASIKTKSALVPGKACSAVLRLERANGDPILPSDLIETHTQKIHLLVVDESLTDYHHEHPVPTIVPGEYSFTFTPRKPGRYRAWADLRPYPLGLQEYAMADMAAATTPEPLRDRTIRLQTTVDGLNYDLVLMSDDVRAGVPSTAKLRITTLDGKPFTRLEPIMATFAHLVAFNEDYQTVLHMHPKGLAVSDPNARGGPELEFQIYSMKPGFYRLFAQVQIDGRSRFAPFGIQFLQGSKE
jgi:hypothetical protein